MDNILDLSEDDIMLQIVLQDELLFMLMFWSDDLSMEMSVEQKMLCCDRSDHVLACTGRKIAKTLIVEAKVVQLGINHIQPGTGITEALLFTPRDSQLTPLVDRIFGRIARTPFFRALVDDMRRGEAPRVTFRSGMTWYCRIEGVSGTDANMVGLRAAFVLGDELAFGNEVCHNSRIQTALPNAKWWYSGVPNGLRNTPFYRIDQTQAGRGWSRHKYPTFVNPIYDDEIQRDKLVDSYHGKNTQGYITQVMGEWGDETISSFPPGSIAIGRHPYVVKKIGSGLQNTDTAVAAALGISALRADRFAIGWDFGFSPDPSMILVAACDNGNKWRVVMRIELRQVAEPIQRRVVKVLLTKILQGPLGAICCDNTSSIQNLQNDFPELSDRIYNTKPGGSMIMTDENGKVILELNEKTGKEEPVMIRVKQYLTERFRSFMVADVLDLPGIRLTLGNDLEFIEELAGTTEAKTQAGYTVYYGPPDPDASGKMQDHSTDAARMLSDAILRSADKEVNSDAELLQVMGWAGQVEEGQEWQAPWQSDPIEPPDLRLKDRF